MLDLKLLLAAELGKSRQAGPNNPDLRVLPAKVGKFRHRLRTSNP